MNNDELSSDVHWLIKMAQEIRETGQPQLSFGNSVIDADLAHPSLSVLGELIDRCSFDIEPEFLRGYSYGLNQAGLIDDEVLKAIEKHIGECDDHDLASKIENKH